MTGPGQLLELRDYQRETIDAIVADWENGIRRPTAVLATGLGKTVCFAHLAKEFLVKRPHERVLVLAHTDELVTQAAGKVKDVAPHLPVGIVKGTRDEVGAAVVIASVQTLRHEKRRRRVTNVGLIIVDECHHATAASYRAILTHFGALDPTENHPVAEGVVPNPLVRAVGFTATLARGDGESLASVWQKVSISRDILFGITHNENGPCEPGHGFLLDVGGVRVEVPDLDLSTVKKSRGDFQDADLGRAMTESLAPEVVADAYLKHADGRSALAFWPTVDAAYVGAEAMITRGITAEVIHGKLNPEDRRLILKRFMAGETKVICNCMVLTEGFDAPLADVAIIARPTKSKPLYQQIVGRVLRPYQGQFKALILDVCGTSRTNDLCCLDDLTEKEVVVKEGQTLAEAVREAEEQPVVAPYRGPVTFDAFDPFSPLARKSKRVWMQTAGSVHFLAYGDKRYLFLVPTTVENGVPGHWDVAWCTNRRNLTWMTPNGPRLGDFTEHRDLDLSMAMKWAETMVDNNVEDGDFGRKGATWRKRPASEKQLNYARRLGCTVTEGMTGDEVSLAIDVATASPLIDYYVSKIVGG